MKSDAEILKEFVEKHDVYNSLSTKEKIIYAVTVRYTIEFKRYLLKTRIKEWFKINYKIS